MADRWTRLLAAWVRVTVWAAAVLAARPQLPPQRRWALCGPDEPHALVVFSPDEHGFGMHVSTLVVEDCSTAYMVDLSPLGRAIVFLNPEAAPECYDTALSHGAEYIVRVPFKPTTRNCREQVTGAMDCVALAKRVAAVYAPDVFTPRQLLAHLWRKSL